MMRRFNRFTERNFAVINTTVVIVAMLYGMGLFFYLIMEVRC